MSNYIVAKSYQNLPQIGVEYTINGKTYIKVRMNSGDLKQVRTYSEKEYKKYYPEMKDISVRKSQKEILGFGEAGYIWLFKGKNSDLISENSDWFKSSPARYSRIWGWYIPSNIEIPNPLPYGIEPITLYWSLISEDDVLLSEDKLIKIVDELIYPIDEKSFIGEIGERVTYKLHVDQIINLENQWGSSTMHIFSDASGNVFVWTTSTTPLKVNCIYTVTGTIKDHKIYKGSHQNILTRCRCSLVEEKI